MGLKLHGLKGRIEAGVDEAGRGCLAGPVTAAAVIPGKAGKAWLEAGLNDSKQINATTRQTLRARIETLNILKASHLAMHRAIDALQLEPEFLLIDGNRFQAHTIPHSCEIKGDGRFLSIAAASILAKTHRDELMLKLDTAFPMYAWESNKGYPTKAHKLALSTHGTCLHHRKTFKW